MNNFYGIIDKNINFVVENSLLDNEAWALFAEQFSRHTDIDDKGWRGEYFGKMMRGACMVYQYTKSDILYEILTDAAKKMLETADSLGRFSTYSVGEEFTGWDMWSRKYVLLGFLHFYGICKDKKLKEKILNALIRHLDYIADRIGEGKRDIDSTSDIWLGINSASILEPVILMYNLTKKEKYLELARHIIKRLEEGEASIITHALEDKILPYQYPTTKAYEMMSCFEGLLEYYLVTGEEKWRIATENFVAAVEKSEITIIGCAGCKHELFNNSVRMQTDTDYDGPMQETCVSVTWMKLCAKLLLLTGNTKYADNIERTMYNALYGAVNTEKCEYNGEVFPFDSYSPLTKGNRGTLVGGYKNISDKRHYGCCVAIGAAGVALPALLAVTEDKGNVFVNFYEKGNCTLDSVSLKIDTDYPKTNKVTITVTGFNEGFKKIFMRIPGYSQKTKIYLNKKECSNVIERNWEIGDTIEIYFDFTPQIHFPLGVEGKEETKSFFAITRGPLVLAKAWSGAVKFDKNFTLTEITPVKEIYKCKVKMCDSEFEMSDYSSMGKNWKDAPIEAWIKIK